LDIESHSLMIESDRLKLLPILPRHLLLLIESPDQFPQSSGLHAESGMREFFVSDYISSDYVKRLGDSTQADPWQFGFFVIDRASNHVVGTAGFKGPPDEDGMVEIAYGIVPSFEGRGYATEVAGQLVAFAVGDPRVRNIRAHTLPETNASTRVLEKNGFAKIGAVEDPEDGQVWRWEWKK
jgi:RimJ/RimL family protein N-acetyltransferase